MRRVADGHCLLTHDGGDNAEAVLELMTAAEAIAEVERAGLRSEIYCGLGLADEHFSVAVSTIDPDPTISVRLPGRGRGSDMLLSDRQQFGPESWDYPAHLQRVSERVLLRIWSGQEYRDVPAVSAVAALFARLGWSDDAQRVTPLSFSASGIREALLEFGR